MKKFLENLKILYMQLSSKKDQAVARQLFRFSLTVATAESCTGGLISSRLTDISGSSTYVKENYITYSEDAKVDTLGVDREILERIKTEIEIENPIHDFTSRAGFDYSELAWTCKEHREELKKYSIVPQKTFILEPPTNLDKKYWLDYIRGYFDGDGSVNFIEVNGKKHYTALRWQICSATPCVLEFVLDVLESYGIKKVNIQKQKRETSDLYYIQYSTNATKEIYKILYSTDSTLYLTRKKKHFEEIIQKINNK